MISPLAMMETVDLPSGTLTFLLSDVEGSTALWEAAREAMAVALPRSLEIVEAVAHRKDASQQRRYHLRRSHRSSRHRVLIGLAALLLLGAPLPASAEEPAMTAVGGTGIPELTCVGRRLPVRAHGQHRCEDRPGGEHRAG